MSEALGHESQQNGLARWSVPGSWAWERVGDICPVVGGGTPPTGDESNFAGGDIPWLTPADLSGFAGTYIARGARNITRKGLDSSAARILPSGTVLFSSRAPIGYVAIAANELATNQGFKSFVPPLGLEPAYLFHYLHRAKGLAVELASGTTFMEISGKRAAQIPLAVAPTSEQHRIVAKIEELFSDLDAGVAALERVKTNLKRYRASVLKAAVEGKLTARWRAENPDVEPASELLKRILVERRQKWEEAELAKYEAKEKTPPKGWSEKYKEPVGPDVEGLPELPEGWCWATVGQLFTVVVGATPSRRNPAYWSGPVPWVSSGEVQFCRISSTRETITYSGLRHSSARINPIGSVLVGMIGEGKTRGQAAILDIEAANNQNCAAIHVSATPVQPQFIFHWFSSRYEATRRLGSGGNQPALNKARVEGMVVPLPPIQEQRELIAETDQLLSIVDVLDSLSTQALARAARLRQSILKRAFEGKLVPQDPTDEPASVLLERIKAEREAAAKHAKTTKKRSGEARAASSSGKGFALVPTPLNAEETE